MKTDLTSITQRAFSRNYTGKGGRAYQINRTVNTPHLPKSRLKVASFERLQDPVKLKERFHLVGVQIQARILHKWAKTSFQSILLD